MDNQAVLPAWILHEKEADQSQGSREWIRVIQGGPQVLISRRQQQVWLRQSNPPGSRSHDKDEDVH